MSRIRALVRGEMLSLKQCAEIAGITYDGAFQRWADGLRGDDLIAKPRAEGEGDARRTRVKGERRERERVKRARLLVEISRLLEVSHG